MNIRGVFYIFCLISHSLAASTISQIVKNAEHTHNIRPGLLTAIGKVESSMKPYVINHRGRSLYFKNIAEASQHARKLIARGQNNFSVGCFQLHYKTHGKQFPSIEKMFEPSRNIEYAAKLLKKLYRQNGTWKQAVGKYHSAKPHLSARYVLKVARKYGKQI